MEPAEELYTILLGAELIDDKHFPPWDELPDRGGPMEEYTWGKDDFRRITDRFLDAMGMDEGFLAMLEREAF